LFRVSPKVWILGALDFHLQHSLPTTLQRPTFTLYASRYPIVSVNPSLSFSGHHSFWLGRVGQITTETPLPSRLSHSTTGRPNLRISSCQKYNTTLNTALKGEVLRSASLIRVQIRHEASEGRRDICRTVNSMDWPRTVRRLGSEGSTWYRRHRKINQTAG
jgi:hypothetical protein